MGQVQLRPSLLPANALREPSTTDRDRRASGEALEKRDAACHCAPRKVEAWPSNQPASKGLPWRSKLWWKGLWLSTLWRSLVVLVLCGLAGAYYATKLDVAYPIKDWAFWPIAQMWLYNAVFFSAVFSAGMRVLTWLKIRGTALERFAFAMPAGVLAVCLCMYGLGAAHLFNRPAMIVLALGLLLSGAKPSLRLVRGALRDWTTPGLRPDPLLPRLIRVAAVVYGVVCLVVLYLPVLTPETLNFDAQWCHLTVAQDYAREGRIIPYDGDYARNHPQLAPLIHTWFWLMPVPSLMQRWTLPLHTEFFMVMFSLPGVAATVRYLLGQRRVRMAWVGFFLFPAIFVYDMNIGGSSDHFFGLFIAPLFIAVARAATSFSRRYLMLAALMGGGALMTKYQSAYILPVCGVVLLGGMLIGITKSTLVARRSAGGFSLPKLLTMIEPRRRFLALLLSVGLFGLVVAPHFLRNWIFYHNPVYPFMQGVFHSRPTQKDAVFYFENVFQDYNWRPHGTRMQRIASSLQLLGTFSFSPSYYFFRTDWPIFGSLFTFSIPLALVVRRARRLWLGIFVSLGAIFTWAMTFRVERNLQGFVPLIAATTLALLVRAWQLGWFARVGVLALVALQVIWGGDELIYSQYGRLTAAINLFRAGYERTTAQRWSTHPLVEMGKTLPANAKVLYHQGRTTLGLNRVVALDLTGSEALFNYTDVTNVRDLVNEWQKGGITHVMYDLPTGIGRETRKLEVLFQMARRAIGPGKSFGSYALMDIRGVHGLPAEQGLRVISLGIPGYQDGLYPVTALGVNEWLDNSMRHYPTPEQTIPTDPAALGQLVDEACAALIWNGRGGTVQKDMSEKGWSAVHSYPSYFSVFLPPDQSPSKKHRHK